MPATLAPSTLRLLERLPPFAAQSKDISAVIDVLSRELDRVDAAKEQVRAQATPQTADALLGAWETVLGIPVAPVGQTIAQRRITVVGYMQRLKSIATGPEWVAALTRLIGTAWTYEEFIPVAERLTNLVTNPSFETNTTGWGTAAVAGRVATGATLTRVTSTFQVGAAAMQVVTTAAATAQGADFPTIAVVAGRTYWVSAYVKGNAGGEPLALVIGDATVGIASQAFAATTGFQRISFLYTPTASGTTGVAVVDTTAAIRTFFVDAVQVAHAGGQPLAAVPAYFDGSMTGYEWSGAANASTSRKVNTVPANTVRVTLPYAPALAAPAGPSATPTTTGGVLAAGTWHYKVTAYNTYGETTGTADFTGVTTGATSKNTLAWTAVAGASGYRVYRGTTSSNHTLIQDVATNGYVDVGGQAPSTVTPPLVNTTQGFAPEQARNLARDITPAHIDLQFVYSVGFILGVSKLGSEVL